MKGGGLGGAGGRGKPSVTLGPSLVSVSENYQFLRALDVSFVLGPPKDSRRMAKEQA